MSYKTKTDTDKTFLLSQNCAINSRYVEKC